MAEQYIIVRQNHEWKISFKDKLYGPYDSERDAIEAALDAAYSMGEIGIEAQVIVQDANLQSRVEWDYGQDFSIVGR